MKSNWIFLLVFFFYGYSVETEGQIPASLRYKSIINPEGKTLQTRIETRPGYLRIKVKEQSFAAYLRTIPLQPDGSKVRYYDGRLKTNNIYDAVIKMDVGNRDLQQCADAVMRLRAEYLFQAGRSNEIHFNFTNGFRADYKKWKEGYRIAVNGNRASWIRSGVADPSYASFRKYLDKVFSYAGTLSLSKELTSVEYKDIQPGDVLIHGGSPGHAVIVMDVAMTAEGKKVYLLAQSYMPAQEIHVLKNPNDLHISPWYLMDEAASAIETPGWTFTTKDLKRFTDSYATSLTDLQLIPSNLPKDLQHYTLAMD